MDKLIVKYLQNNLSLQEQHQLSKWLEEDEQNKETLRRMEVYWRDYGLDLEVIEQLVKGNLARRIENEQVGNTVISFSIRNLIRVAAMLIVAGTIIFSLYRLYEVEPVEQPLTYEMIEKKSALGEKVTIKLPDGSTVKLNSGSSITYPQHFQQGKREVILKGEGFFEITKDLQSPFIVKVNRAMVRVLGTSFNINAKGSSNKVIVGVKTGQVKVSNEQQTISRILEPYDLVVYNDENQLMRQSKISDPELIFGWTDQLLVFEDSQFKDILNTMTNWYGVEFILSINIESNRVYTSRFENPTLKSVMESLSYVYDFNYEINDNVVIIK